MPLPIVIARQPTAISSRLIATSPRPRPISGPRLVEPETGAAADGAIYGETDVLPTPATSPALPMAPYGQSKFCAERYLAPYVGDLTAALITASELSAGGVLNIGTHQETSVLDLVRLLGEIRGEDTPEPRFERARLGEVTRSCLDSERARQVLDWEASTSIQEGLRHTYAAALD